MGSRESGGAGVGAGRARTAVADTAETRSFKVTFDEFGRGTLNRIMGREVSDEEIAQLSGAQDGDRIFVSGSMGSVSINVKNPGMQHQSMTLYSNFIDDELRLVNTIWSPKLGAKVGYEVELFADQVKGARALGINKIWAVIDEFPSDSYNWPDMGFNANLSRGQINRIPSNIRSAMKGDTVKDLYDAPGGRDWFKSNEESITVIFDTQPGSESNRVLENYRKG